VAAAVALQPHWVHQAPVLVVPVMEPITVAQVQMRLTTVVVVVVVAQIILGAVVTEAQALL
jgi:hypothetical protein